MSYFFDPNKHSSPIFKYDLNKFYFVVHNYELLIFEKNNKGKKK